MPSDDPPDEGKNQTYKGKVGTVNNADTIHIHNELGRLGPIGGKISDRALLAPTLIDRGPQLNLLVERLDAMLEKGVTHPLLVIVPGCVDDLHQAFVVRCALIEFISEFGDVGDWKYLKRLTWPEGATSVDQILRDVRDRLGLPKAYRRRPDIEANIAKTGQHLCWCHVVDLDEWRQDDGALLKKWADYVMNGSIKTAPDHFLIAFLCLVIDEEPGPTSQMVERFIEEIRPAEEQESSRLLITPPLGAIRQKHLADWVGEASHYIGDDLLEAQLLALPNELYSDAPPERRRLADFYQHVAEALSHAIKGRVRGVENEDEPK